MEKDDCNRWRRNFVAGLGAVPVAAATLGVSRARAQPPGGTVAGIREAENVARWRIVAIHPVKMGAIPIVLETRDGQRFQVDVLRRDPALSGVAETEHFSLFVANGGDGATVTNEEQGLGAMALAERLRERERAGADIPALSTHRERLVAHPLGDFAVPLD